ncbi:hypothetical protein [Rhodoglobus sp.]
MSGLSAAGRLLQGSVVGAASTISSDREVVFLGHAAGSQIADALSQASARGDDSIQKLTQGQVTPEPWTNQSRSQRQR